MTKPIKHYQKRAIPIHMGMALKLWCLLLLLMSNVFTYAQTGATFTQWGEETLAAIERDFRLPNSPLYKENLTSGVAFNWPLGIQFHALVAAGKITQAEAMANGVHSRYWCFKNNRWAYNASADDCGSRFYDDNAWMAKGLMELYGATNNATYLNRAKEVLAFVMSGEFAASSDPMRTTGSIRWDEGTTNWCLCASAPAAAANLMVYDATGEVQYLNDGTRVYNWAKTNRWGVGPGYRGYENAVLCQAAIGLYQATGNVVYLNDARSIGYKMETHYVDVASHALFETGQWGGHDMTNAYVELYELTHDVNWLNIAAGYLSFLHNNCKDTNGRYPEEWSNAGVAGQGSLLFQAPAACAYAKMGTTPGGAAKLPDPVAIYRDCNFPGGGWNTGLLIGQYTKADLEFLGVPDNDLSSVRVQPGYRITLYENDNFTGASVVKTADASCLAGEGWSDRATSLVVDAISPTVIVYDDCNYAGHPVNLTPGSYTLAQLQAKGINDNIISSLKVTSGYRVEVFDNADFTGATASYTADNSCVGSTWNDRVSSIRIFNVNEPATFYNDCNYGGSAASLPAGDYDLNALVARGITNDAISSLKVTAGYEVVVYQDWNFTGAAYILSQDYSCLTSTGIDNWISSIKVRPVSTANAATLYVDCNYGGTSAALPPGNYDMNALVARSIPNDAVSSLKVNPGYELVAYQDWNFTGASQILIGDVACLTSNGIDNWTSSVRVRARVPGSSPTLVTSTNAASTFSSEELTKRINIRIIPNPTNGSTKLSIDLMESGYTEVNVQSSIGKVVSSIHQGHLDAGHHEFDFNAERVPAGLYICVVRQKGMMVSEKVIKR